MRPIDNKTARWFSGLWGLGFLFHYESLYRTGWDIMPYTAFPLLAMGVILLVRPGMTRMFIAACALHTLEVLIKTYLEVVHVSWFISGTVSATIVFTWVRSRGSLAGVLSRSVPTIRAIVLVLYFYAVFHKLNAGYFSVEHVFPASRIARLPLLGHVQTLVDHAAVLGLCTEALIGIFLAIPRTRLLGVAIGGSFHGALGYTAFSQFAYLYPLYMLFLDPPAGPVLSKFWERAAPRRRRPELIVLGVFLLATEQALEITGVGLRKVIWTCLVVAGGVSLAVYAKQTRRAEKAHPGKKTSPAKIAFTKGPIALFVWCFLPYFGLLSHPCVTMYSELRVDSGVSNHYIVPAALQLDAIHDDLATIEDVSPRRQFSQFPKGRVVPYQALRHWLILRARSGRAPRRLVYTYRKERHEVIDGDLGPGRFLDYIPVFDYNYRLIVRIQENKINAWKRRQRERRRSGPATKTSRRRARD